MVSKNQLGNYFNNIQDIPCVPSGKTYFYIKFISIWDILDELSVNRSPLSGGPKPATIKMQAFNTRTSIWEKKGKWTLSAPDCFYINFKGS